MSILDKKNEIFADVAAAKIIIDEDVRLVKSITSSFPSINNGGDVVLFLTDLIKSLVGFDVLIKKLVDILSFKVPIMEEKTKKAIKHALQDTINSDKVADKIEEKVDKGNDKVIKVNDSVKKTTGINPQLPPFIKSDAGMTIPVDQIDFFDLFKVNPYSTGGNLLYSDIPKNGDLTKSSDFNTFLAGVIQAPDTEYTWKDQFKIQFNPNGNGVTPNNTLTIKATPQYDGTTKTLTDLNNDFVDSLTLFTPKEIVNNVINTIFGSIGVSVNKTQKQLEISQQINTIVDCIVNSDTNDVIDDTYFTFTNEDVFIQQENAGYLKNGVIKLECCNKVAASVPASFLTDFSNDMDAVDSGTTGNKNVERTAVITRHLNLMADQNTINSPDVVDHYAIKINFVQNIIQNLIKTVISMILRPSVSMILLIKLKTTLGPAATFTDPNDFIKQNKNLFRTIIKQISGMIIQILLALALKEIGKLVAGTWAARQIEKAKDRRDQLFVMLGVNRDRLKQIQQFKDGL